jgi:hypothetical protein
MWSRDLRDADAEEGRARTRATNLDKTQDQHCAQWDKKEAWPSFRVALVLC